MSGSVYVLDNRATEAKERLDSLGALFDRVTFRHLQALGVGAGARCLEVGAGGDSVVRWLSERVGPSGHVLATDLEPRWLAGLSLPNVEVRRHDIAREPLPSGAFDFIHVRLVLSHVPRYEDALARMAGALAPGGWLLAEDFDSDLVPDACWEEVDADGALANKVRQAFRDLISRRGVHLHVGRRLPRLLEAQSLVDVGAEGHLTVRGGEPARGLERSNVAQLSSALVEARLLDPEELRRFFEILEAGAIDPSFPPLISAWGRRPG